MTFIHATSGTALSGELPQSIDFFGFLCYNSGMEQSAALYQYVPPAGPKQKYDQH